MPTTPLPPDGVTLDDIELCDEIIGWVRDGHIAVIPGILARHRIAATSAAEGEIEALRAERDEADRRAGELARKNEHLEDAAQRRAQWLWQAKKDLGYDPDISFDHVWAEVLRGRTKAEADVEALHGREQHLTEMLHRENEARVEAEAANARLMEALRDVVNPLGYLQRYAAARGKQLSGSAYGIAHDLNFVRKIAQGALDQGAEG